MAEIIPRDFIQLLLSRVEIVDLIDGRLPLRKKTGSNFFACCPFHNEKSPSFSVSQTKQFYYCFGCGAHGNAIDFLMQFDRQAFPEAIETLAKLVGMEIPRESRKSDRPVISANLYELLDEVAKFYQQQLKLAPRAVDYLKQRGLVGEIAKEFGVGFAPAGWDHVLQTIGKSAELKQQLLETGMLIKKEDGGLYDRFRERIMFPIFDRQGRIVGFGGRIIDKGDPKYLNSPETLLFQKGHELYGLYHAMQANRQLSRVLIVEGYMDVIALFQHDITYAVATLGTATTAHHIQRLLRHTTDIIFCFDGDQAGRTAAWRALLVILPLMRDGFQIRFLFLPDGEDPDSLVRKEGKIVFEERIQNAATFSSYFFQALATQTDLSSMDGRARYVKLATEHLSQLQPGIFQQMMLEELAKRARIDIKQLNPATQQPVASHRQKARSPSTFRFAFTLLVQHPELAKLVTQPLPELDIAGFDLFKAVMSLAQNTPNLSTGSLLEHWRDQEDGKTLSKLAQTELMMPDEGVENEFLGAMQQIQKLGHDRAIDYLLSKANQGDLTETDKKQLHELINDKFQQPTAEKM